MAVTLRPQLRPVELFPVGSESEQSFVLRDPEGFGQAVVLPLGAALLATLMDGRRTLAEIQADFAQQTGTAVALTTLERLVRDLERARLLETPQFQAYRRRQMAAYLGHPVRPAAHAGGAYASDPEELRADLARLFTAEGGPGPIDPTVRPNGRALRAAISPHIDLHRGGVTFAWAYKWVVEQSQADCFVLLGTAHAPLEQPFSVTRKDFATPLGTVTTDRALIDRLAEHLGSSLAGQQLDLFADELAHRHEHSLEFQAMFLQYVLGGQRPFCIVPILVGSLQPYIEIGSEPSETPEFAAFVAALRAAVGTHPGKVCYISGADLAHIGPRFGDPHPLTPARLADQSQQDRRLLEAVCRGDAGALFRQVAACQDRNRICGLAPTYTLLHAAGTTAGELLRYDQAVEPDGSSCVSFASVALYER